MRYNNFFILITIQMILEVGSNNVNNDDSNSPTSICDDTSGWQILFKEEKSHGADEVELIFCVPTGKTENQFTASVYDHECHNKNDDASIFIKNTWIELNQDKNYDIGHVQVKLRFESIQNNEFWADSSSSEETVTFCVRTELILPRGHQSSLSVGFQETIVNAQKDIGSGYTTFRINDVELSKLETNKVEKRADDDINACICDEFLRCINEAIITQDSEFSLCISPKSTEFSVKEFNEFYLYQDGQLKFTAVLNGVPNLLTVISLEPQTKVAHVRTRLIGNFFRSQSLQKLSISGSVILGLKASDTLHRRNLKESSPHAMFEVNAKIDLGRNMQRTFFYSAIMFSFVSMILFKPRLRRFKNTLRRYRKIKKAKVCDEETGNSQTPCSKCNCYCNRTEGKNTFEAEMLEIMRSFQSQCESYPNEHQARTSLNTILLGKVIQKLSEVEKTK